MKLLIAISMFCFSTMCVAVIMEVYDITDTHMLLTDLPEDGNSEKEASENTEDDSEKDSFELVEHTTPSTSKVLLNRFSNLSNTWHYMEIPSPPPQTY